MKLRLERRAAALDRASVLLRELTETLGPHWDNAGIAQELQMIFDWLHDERERLQEIQERREHRAA